MGISREYMKQCAEYRGVEWEWGWGWGEYDGRRRSTKNDKTKEKVDRIKQRNNELL